jgi:pyrimidine-nucleoside phosphorylase
MSKKLAVMSDGIVLDVKTGSGAFMKSVHESAELARAMVDIAKLNQKKVVAIVTNMNQPLGETVGNSIEVLEAIQTMKGDGPSDLTELCFELAARMIQISGIDTYQNSKIILEKNIRSGKVAEIAKKWIQAQGGEPKVIDDPESYLNISSDKLEFRAQKDGYIFKIDTQAVGVASMVLGAGRAKKEDVIDPSVGIKVVKKLGDYVKKGEVIAYIYKSAASNYEESLNLLENAYAINKEKPDSDEYKLIYEVIE